MSAVVDFYTGDFMTKWEGTLGSIFAGTTGGTGSAATPTTPVAPHVGDTPTTNPEGDLPAAGTTGTNVKTPDTDALAVARAQLEASQTSEYQSEAEQKIFQQKVKEQATESSMRAGAAARGLKLEGSPLYQLHAQQTAAEKGIAGEERQVSANVQQMQNTSNQEYGSYLLQKNLDTSAQWMSAFTGVLNLGTSALGLWNPVGERSTDV